jgi:hypothetical protein
MAVVEAVANESGHEPEALAALYGVVNPDALEALFENASEGADSRRRVVFTYEGYEVAVSDDDRIEVTPTETL